MNETHDPDLTCWVESANRPDSDFPLQNLPYGVFRAPGTGEFRGGVAIGDSILDLRMACDCGAFQGRAHEAAMLAAQGELNSLMAAGPDVQASLRLALSRALRAQSEWRESLRPALLPRASVQMGLPARIGDYTDFYSSIYHATSVGRLFRPDQPLMPNYRWLPIAYHGRSSSIGVSPQDFPRPRGQRLPHGAAQPQLAPSQRLDYEVELGAYIGAGNERGAPVSIAAAERQVFGLCLLNDWSARDIQGWEYQPLGPFLGKNFATTVSPWIVTLEALEPYRVPWERAASDAAPLAYLDDPATRARGAIDIRLEAWIETAAMRAAGQPPVRLSHSSFRHAYWTLGQMVAHHTVNGCNLRPGDLLGTGTQSGPEPAEAGSLLELSGGGRQAVELSGGEQRRFLEDGDAIILRGFCERPGAARIGFGEARGCVQPAANI
jgi:fumarylacetoacetase